MGRREFSVRQIAEVLAHWDANRGIRQIARSLGMDPKTVRGPLVDPFTGVRRRVWGFLMTLAFSRHMFLRPVLRLDLPTWLEHHVLAFEFFGGVPRRLASDNLRDGVVKPDLYDPQMNRSYAELAGHYGTLIDPARAGRQTPRGTECSLRQGEFLARPRVPQPGGGPGGGAGLVPGRGRYEAARHHRPAAPGTLRAGGAGAYAPAAAGTLGESLMDGRQGGPGLPRRRGRRPVLRSVAVHGQLRPPKPVTTGFLALLCVCPLRSWR